MVKKRIVIVTGTGGILGTGHLQRMLNLASYLDDKNDFEVSILLDSGNYPLPVRFSEMVIHKTPTNADLIIRDMRDSSQEEIFSLGRIAPVLAVDDAGKGRDSADFSIDLLPRPTKDSAALSINMGSFLYGYNFTQGIKTLENEFICSRNIDITIYAGFNPPPDLLSLISRSIPEERRAIILSAGKPVVLTGEPLPDNISYAGILSESKIIMTHFGITMFEADICGCKIAALNPTPYHSELTDSIRRDIKLIHSAEYSSFDPVLMYDDLENNLKKETDPEVSRDEIMDRINSGLENFTRYIYKILM